MKAERWTAPIAQVTEDFRQIFLNLTIEEPNWKPDARTWSIAQNIDHLMMVNESYFPVLDGLQDGTYRLGFAARVPFAVNFFGKTVLKSVQPDRKRKTKTFTLWEPRPSNLPPDMLEQLEKHQATLSHKIEQSMDLVKRGAVIASPANKHIVYKLETAFDIIVAHEQRHLAQAQDTLAQLRKETQQS